MSELNGDQGNAETENKTIMKEYACLPIYLSVEKGILLLAAERIDLLHR